MPPHILVPLDLSRHAEEAAAVAVELAKPSHGRVTLLHVRPRTAPPTRGAEEGYLAGLSRGLADSAGAEVAWEIRTGRAEEVIPRFTSENRIDLIALTAAGQGGESRAWLGGVAEAVVRTAPVPVLVLRNQPAEMRHMLVALDGGPVADGVVSAAAEFAALAGCRLTLARVGEPYRPEDEGQTAFITPWAGTATLSTTRQELSVYLRAKADLIREQHPDVGCAAIIAPRPVEALLDAAAEHGCDLLAVGASGQQPAYLGGVADKLLRGFDGSVLVCRPTD